MYFTLLFIILLSEAKIILTGQHGPTILTYMKVVASVGSHRYFEPILGTKVNWVEAKGICEGAKLKFAKINNSEEYTLIYEKLKMKDYWIAGAMKGFNEDTATNAFTYKSFEWTDGTPIIPENIKFIHPSGKSQCLYLDGDHTYVDSCMDAKHGVLCEQQIGS